MKLLLDIGNTRIKAVIAEGDTLTSVPFDFSLFSQYPISQLTYASVRLAQRIEDIIAVATDNHIPCIEATTSAQAFGIQSGYDKFETLGIDRWLAVLGAAGEYPQTDVIVVDAGTATTVDFLTKENQHLGGWIIPGLHLMTSSIANQADKVFDEANTAFAYGAGDSTPKALKHGCLAAQCGIVDQAVRCFNKQAKIILTGGSADVMLPHLSHHQIIRDDMIVFKGLARF